MSPDFDFWDHDDSPEPKEKFSCKHLKIIQPDGFDKPELVCIRDRMNEKICDGMSCKLRKQL